MLTLDRAGPSLSSLKVATARPSLVGVSGKRPYPKWIQLEIFFAVRKEPLIQNRNRTNLLSRFHKALPLTTQLRNPNERQSFRVRPSNMAAEAPSEGPFSFIHVNFSNSPSAHVGRSDDNSCIEESYLTISWPWKGNGQLDPEQAQPAEPIHETRRMQPRPVRYQEACFPLRSKEGCSRINTRIKADGCA